MDESNLANLNKVKPKGSRAQIKLFGSYDPQGDKIIRDPYYGGQSGFDRNFAQVTRCTQAFLDELGHKQ
ncbi:Low molecular weight phosphotyrosine protein phosphatase [Tieghemiomyces parasiticus]|uniref:Low molecular weight phosphotyrosine protein phosphatase n=1 Tax=Tieghemiomyces parasiticus TaxID=78921 RepID=A0A9W7ZY59_9FUNG|nr:Low molecular weight phosphotyrosine protein phosphatase [Tieghemiomyces parasiticus]